MKHESVCTWHFLIGLSEKGWNQQKSTSFSWWVLLDSKWNESATCSINHQPLQSGGKIDFSGTAWCYLLAWKIMWLHQLYWLHIQATYLVLIDGVYSDCFWVYFRDWIDKKKDIWRRFLRLSLTTLWYAKMDIVDSDIIERLTNFPLRLWGKKTEAILPLFFSFSCFTRDLPFNWNSFFLSST